MIILTIILVQVLCCHLITKITRNGINGAMFVSHPNLNTLLPFSMRVNGTFAKPKHPSFHFAASKFPFCSFVVNATLKTDDQFVRSILDRFVRSSCSDTELNSNSLFTFTSSTHKHTKACSCLQAGQAMIGTNTQKFENNLFKFTSSTHKSITNLF